MNDTINFIIIDPIVGQYTMSFDDVNLSFLTIKQQALKLTWCHVEQKDNLLVMPIMSTNADPDQPTIEEDKELSFYNLQNGGTIFIHYIKFDLNKHIFEQLYS